MNGALSVGVVGCGTAGAASAIFLARAGHDVTVYERVPNPSAIGAGIVMQPTGLAVLAELGLRDAVVARGARIDRLRCETPHGRRVVDLSYATFDRTMFGVGLHRGVLFEALYRALLREPVRVRLGVEIARVRRDGARHALETEVGERFAAHDLVIVADGARSRLRDAALIGKRVRRYEWGAIWAIAEDRDRAFTGELFQIVDGTQRMLGLLPTGLGPDGAHAHPLVSIFWSLRGDEVDRFRAGDPEAWKREVARYAPSAEPLLATIDDPRELLFAVYHDVAMSRWHEPGVVYLGDAAHAMSPQLGQGCNLALVDAWTLARSIASHDDLASALAAYSARREAHLRFYTLATRWLTPFFQSDSALLGFVRDYGMSAMGAFPFFRETMTASMCGIMTGVFSKDGLPR
jgi:2-polyprenyl-6-methoxyphenol hydroxylase-like FAD-dependent oxidoreductase